MALERLKNSVLEEARADAQRIISSADKERDSHLEETRQRAEFERSARLEEERKRLAQAREQALSNALRIERIETLAEKSRLLEQVFASAKESLASLPDPDYLGLLEKWLLSLDPDVSGELGVNSRDADRLTPQFLARVNQARPASGQFTLGPTDLPIQGGVIVSSGRFQIDLSLDTIFQSLQQTITPHLATILFSEASDD